MGLAFGLACLLRLDTLTAFGGLLGIRVARRAVSERNLSRRRAARTGGKGRPG